MWYFWVLTGVYFVDYLWITRVQSRDKKEQKKGATGNPGRLKSVTWGAVAPEVTQNASVKGRLFQDRERVHAHVLAHLRVQLVRIGGHSCRGNRVSQPIRYLMVHFASPAGVSAAVLANLCISGVTPIGTADETLVLLD
jgi:hypothetical protein